MERCLHYFRLYPGTETEFDRLHAEIPAEVAEAMAEAGLHNVTAFRRGTAARPGETAIPVREVVPPLVLRSRRKGDRIDGPRGSVTLKSLCAGWKVSPRRAALAPVLVDRRGVVAVFGEAIGAVTATRSPGPEPGEECLLVRIAGGAKERRA